MEDYQFCLNMPESNYLESYDLNNHHDLERVIEIFCDDIESGYFLRWEAVQQHEQGLPLTEKQEEALSEIFCFDASEDIDDEIQYVDGIARSSETWHVILNKIVAGLPVSNFKTFDIHCAATTEGWAELAEVIEDHGDDLSLPGGISNPIDVVPAATRHKLWIQWCFSVLEGIGQDKEITLENKEQFYRIEDFIEILKDCRDSVEYLQLTLTKLLTILILPPKDQRILVDTIMEKLKMPSPDHLMADYF